jgi:predicted nucleotidyltransferase
VIAKVDRLCGRRDHREMIREKAFDLFSFVEELTKQQPWIERIQIFGSRRYVSNVSYGSDIDLLIHTNEETSTEKLAVRRGLVRPD